MSQPLFPWTYKGNSILVRVGQFGYKWPLAFNLVYLHLIFFSFQLVFSLIVYFYVFFKVDFVESSATSAPSPPCVICALLSLFYNRTSARSYSICFSFIGFLCWVNVFWKWIWKESIMQFCFKSGAVFFCLDLFLLQQILKTLQILQQNSDDVTDGRLRFLLGLQSCSF